MRGSDYAELRAFAAIAEHGSFVRAAAHLGLSPSALSQTIRTLEERLGVRLLNRTTRSVAPSEAGARLLAKLRPALDDLDAAVALVRDARDTPAGLLRINASRIAAVQHIAPLLGEFHARYPDIVVDLVADDRLVDIVAGRFDAGVRLGEMVEQDMVTVRLGGDAEMMVVAAPDYLRDHGVPRDPRELRRHRCINFRWPTDGSLYHWEFERTGANGSEKLEAAVEGPLIVTEPEVARCAALDGVGLAYLFDFHVREHLDAGRLQRVLADWTPAFPGFFLYYPSRRQMPAPLRAFVDFVHQRQAPTPARQRPGSAKPAPARRPGGRSGRR
ncbi:DNA-binding transcriptional regulator, LysR family [Lysobacter sp. yr284]|uniref:LysR family transcriptional regulator n=1 Tax=Lysobacter sp. yr284 TaxID=1761791 RepID=UPI000896D93A|nr:LysR family transcriptional regulator [Lysobacter sp. yr284]SDZ15142.1 DNA-binding transcriptional regulator, LysR family [Lysobacter sp. yr284]